MHTGVDNGFDNSRIAQAFTLIRSAVSISPCRRSQTLSHLSGGTVFLKLENLQRTGAFKERGALNKLLSLSAQECERGVVTASAGNHAQGVAYHAERLGISADIWMPLTTPLVKISATRQYGAKVILHGTDFDEAFQAAQDHCRCQALTFINPFDDEYVIAGQGTVALELLQQVPKIDAVIIPVGGGGLIAGMAVALKEANPLIRIIGVQASVLPSMLTAVQQGVPILIPSAATLADGIAVRLAGAKTLRLVQKYVDELVVVDEEEIAAAILFLLEREKTLAEGAGAVGVAAILQRKMDLSGLTAAVIVSGGNMDVSLLARIIELGLVKDGRLLRLRIPLPDHPGALHRLTEVIALHRVNIVETSYHRAFHGARLGHTVIDLTMETRGTEHSESLIAALVAGEYEYEKVI